MLEKCEVRDSVCFVFFFFFFSRESYFKSLYVEGLEGRANEQQNRHE